MNNKIIQTSIILILLFGLNTVFAEDTSQIGTFSELTDTITTQGEYVDLYNDYKYDPNIDTSDKFDSVPCMYIGGTNNLTIDGHGHTIDGSNQVGFLYLGYTEDNTIKPSNMIVKNINFINGNNTNTYIRNGETIYESYGAISIINGVNAQFINCTFQNNYALNNGGVIYNLGTLTLINSIITNNLGESAIENNGQLIITNSTIEKNQYGIINGKTVSNTITNITHSIIKNNTIAIYNYGLNNINLEYNAILDNNANIINMNNGIVNAKYNWWGINNPDTKSTGSNIDTSYPAVLTVAPVTSRLEETRVIVDLTYSLNNGEYHKLTELLPTRTIEYSSSNNNGQFINPNKQLIGTVSSVYKANQESATLTIKVDNQESKININLTNTNTDTPTTPTNNTDTTNTTIPITPNNTDTTNTTIIDNNNTEPITNTTIPENLTITTKINTENIIKYYQTSTPFTGKLLDSNNNPIIGHHLDLKLIRTSNGQNKIYDVVTDYLGEFNLPINLAPGTYSAEITYHGLNLEDKTYLPTNNTALITVITVEDNKTNTILTTEQFTEPYNAGKSFTGYLIDNNNNPVMGHHVSVKLTRLSSGASKTYDTVTDYLGQFLLAINLAPGQYTAQCTYTGTDQYQSSTNTNTITIY